MLTEKKCDFVQTIEHYPSYKANKITKEIQKILNENSITVSEFNSILDFLNTFKQTAVLRFQEFN